MFRFSVVAEQYIREHGDNCSHIARNIEKQRVFCAFRGTANVAEFAGAATVIASYRRVQYKRT